ncbi:MAG: ATP-binding protein [Saprospiraceae bacterium]|nr:ATP-binding protein [Saprospiraceae bacterium]
MSILKTSVLYGANASGKSNLIKAIEFGRALVLKVQKRSNPFLSILLNLKKN